ncbi:hypothetical protein [Flavobacterium saccharophilum]|jgi:hypothetical protein|uniref:Cbb3-type cytochrome oxidase component FixQ n=1 Tax=Flavobacterium saccharophilum TaxID=29534 RepID=A0A1M7HTX4_9FLAO|nr:hypothetical protein [Flavobacterium saccharophilum]SHM31934.1 hypothetical protein SAMN05444366_2872 [Flavobacterium saccharophilum]
MTPGFIILIFSGIIVLIMLIYVFIQNNKDRKEYEKELNTPSNLYDDKSEVNDTDKF